MSDRVGCRQFSGRLGTAACQDLLLSTASDRSDGLRSNDGGDRRLLVGTPRISGSRGTENIPLLDYTITFLQVMSPMDGQEEFKGATPNYAGNAYKEERRWALEKGSPPRSTWTPAKGVGLV